jgi:hypothetical protein
LDARAAQAIIFTLQSCAGHNRQVACSCCVGVPVGCAWAFMGLYLILMYAQAGDLDVARAWLCTLQLCQTFHERCVRCKQARAS